MKGFLAKRVLLTPLLSLGLFSVHLQAQEESGKDPRITKVEVPLPTELPSALARARALASAGKAQAVVTLLEKLSEGAKTRLFPASPGRYLPFSRVLDRQIPAMGKPILEAWRLRNRSRAARLLREGLEKRDPALLHLAADRFPATPQRRKALLALADIALEGSRLLEALALLEGAFEGAPPEERPPILARRAFAWACLGAAGETARTLELLASLGKPVPFRGKETPPSLLAQSPAFRPRIHPSPPSWLPEKEARLWRRPFPPLSKWTPPKRNYTFLGFRGGGSLLPAGTGPQENTDPILPEVRFGGNFLFLRRKDGADILEIPTGRLLGTIRRGPSWDSADPALAQPTRPAWALGERQVALAGKEAFFLCRRPSLRKGHGSRFVPPKAFNLVTPVSSPNTVIAYGVPEGTLLWKFDLASIEGRRAEAWIHAGPATTAGVVAVLVQSDRMFTLLGLSGETGKVLWRTPLHSGGSGFTRPPSLPILAGDGVFFAATGAGAVSAVAARTGRILWLTAYPRTDPSAPASPPPKGSSGAWLVPSKGADHTGFQTSPMVLSGGTLVLAPPDGDYLVGLSPLDGRILWLSSRRDPREGPDSPPSADHLVGGDGENVYLAGRKLIAVRARTGVRLWEESLPPVTGRGIVTADRILLPTRKGVFFVEKEPPHPSGILSLPGRPPGPIRLFTCGPFLAGATKDYLALWVLKEEWIRLAATPMEKARRLAICGFLPRALEELDALPPEKARSLRALWTLDLARSYLEEDKKEEALRLLARAEKEIRDPLGRVSLLDLYYRVLLVSGREAEADRVFFELLGAARAAAGEETR